MQLSWRPGFTLDRKPAKRPTRRRSNRKTLEAPSHPRRYKFVTEDPVPICEGLGDNKEYKHQRGQTMTAPHLTAASRDPSTTSTVPVLFLSKPLQYESLTARFRPVLDRYNAEFCQIPLTTDLQINPFQYRVNLSPEPAFLTHAVMALAGHHTRSPTMQQHRFTALRMLRENLGTAVGTPTDPSTMLDTIIILFSLDETQSALGNWAVHLRGAYALLEASGGISSWLNSPRAEVQVGMLVWWDAILALLSREPGIFPATYADAVLEACERGRRGWDFFGLCGCPGSLVKVVIRLAHVYGGGLDPAVVGECERLLKEWKHDPVTTAFDKEELVGRDWDAMCCSEAWRYGLLLYIYRVFRWTPGDAVSVDVMHWARLAVHHAFACRDEGMVARQALLPLIFGACEMTDGQIRQKVLRFCAMWNDRTSYHVFESATPLLKEVWADQAERGANNVWWGQVVDRQHRIDTESQLPMRLCFG